MTKALELAKRNSEGLEQYYTNPSIAEMCVGIAKKHMDGHQIIEPSAGTGEFLKALDKVGLSATGYDIDPKSQEIIKKDFFETDWDNGHYFVIGNPPFGRNHSLSVRFFNHSATFADYIAFIIPKSWRKWSIQNRLDLNFHLVEDVELPKNIFHNENKEEFGSNFNAVFQVWKRSEVKREKVKVSPRDDIVKCSPKEANIALTYAGYSAGKVELEFDRIPNTTKIYLKVSDEVKNELIKMDYTNFTENCAYTPVFGLSEIIQELNYVLATQKQDD